MEHFNCTLADISKVVDNDESFWKLFGRDIQLPIDVMLGKPPVEVLDPVSSVAYVDDLKDKLCEIYDVARTKLLKVVTGKRKPVT